MGNKSFLTSKKLGITRLFFEPGTKPEFDRCPFLPIPKDSENKESLGFELQHGFDNFEIYPNVVGFSVRKDAIKPDPAHKACVAERIRRDQGVVGEEPDERRERWKAAGNEVQDSYPVSTVRVDGVAFLDRGILFYASASDDELSNLIETSRKAGWFLAHTTPWHQNKVETPSIDWLELPPQQNIIGSLFLRCAIRDGDLQLDQSGGVALAKLTQDGLEKIRLSGGFQNDYDSQLEQGAEVLAASVILDEIPFVFKACAWRLSKLRNTTTAESGVDKILQILEVAENLFSKLDDLFKRHYESGALDRYNILNGTTKKVLTGVKRIQKTYGEFITPAQMPAFLADLEKLGIDAGQYNALVDQQNREQQEKLKEAASAPTEAA